jgi:hypothetical protein
MTIPSRTTALAQELDDLRAMFHALVPEVQQDFLRAVRWGSVSRWAPATTTRKARLMYPKAMQALTAVSRMIPGPIDLEYVGPRLNGQPAAVVENDAVEEVVDAPWARLFASVFDGCQGRVELRAFPSKARTFLAPTDHAGTARFLANHEHEDVYFGVATRRDASGGALTNCQHLGAAFADFDFKATPEDHVRTRLARFTPPPTIVVASGGGLHAYWKLATPIPLPEDAPRAKRLLRHFAQALGGDLTAAEPARILRVPGGRNHKYEPPRLVTIEP